MVGGRVIIAWTLDADLVEFTWREVGGPTVTAAAKRGFGSRLLDVVLVPQGGRAERRFEPDGLVCELRIPPAASSRAESSILPGAAFAKSVADARAETHDGEIRTQASGRVTQPQRRSS
jgi:hypothetical protein